MGPVKDEKKLHWVSWRRLCNPKGMVGIRFRDIHNFNLALLAKQGWRIMQNPQSLVANILKARCFPNSSFFYSQVQKNCSFLWRSLVAGQVLLKSSCRWRVGDGKNIKLWKDDWGEANLEFRPQTGIGQLQQNVVVVEIINVVVGV